MPVHKTADRGPMQSAGATGWSGSSLCQSPGAALCARRTGTRPRSETTQSVNSVVGPSHVKSATQASDTISTENIGFVIDGVMRSDPSTAIACQNPGLGSRSGIRSAAGPRPWRLRQSAWSLHRPRHTPRFSPPLWHSPSTPLSLLAVQGHYTVILAARYVH